MKKIGRYYKNLLQSEWKTFRAQIPIPVYVLWWLVRLAMLFAVAATLHKNRETGDQAAILQQLFANLFAAFSVTVLRIVFPKQLFLGRIPYTAQNYGMVLVFFGSFVGHYLRNNIALQLGEFDKVLHILSGFLCVFLTYEVVLAMQHGEKRVTGFQAAVIGFGMGCFVMLAWEFFEFGWDYFYDTKMQDYTLGVPDDGYYVYRFFGQRPANELQTPLFDTFTDLFVAIVSSFPAAGILWHKVSRENRSLRRAQELPASSKCESTENG